MLKARQTTGNQATGGPATSNPAAGRLIAGLGARNHPAAICLLAVCLAGCTTPLTVTQSEAVRLTPPAVLLLETPEPAWRGETNGDLLDYLLEVQAALRACNADKKALRAWAGSAAAAGE